MPSVFDVCDWGAFEKTAPQFRYMQRQGFQGVRRAGDERNNIQMSDVFYEWLSSPECFNDLLPCVRLVIRRAEQLGVTLDDSYLEDGNVKEYHAAVAGNLWQFIKEEAAVLAQKATRYLLERDYKWLATFISREFIDSCIDKRRNDSPFHAYYRHMRNVLSEAKEINYRPVPRKGSYFAWSHKPDLDFIPDNNDFRTRHLNYKEWTSSNISFSEINKQAFMIELSRHYWDEALRVILKEYLHPIRELVSFVAVKYPLIPSVENESDIESDMVCDNEGQGLQHAFDDRFIHPDASGDDDSWIRQLPILAQSIIELDLDKLARDCAARLTDTEKAVLWGLNDSSTLADIARSLGMKGPSNVSYHQKLASEKLRIAWSLWGQPDSEHYAVAEDEQRIFFNKVIELCKEANACRDSRTEDRP
ncbi:MAG: hypothetical protein WCP20_03145 [Desulfuromonadales bacterium]